MVSIKKGLLRRTVGHVKAVDRVDVTVRGHNVGVVGNRVRQDDAGWAYCGWKAAGQSHSTANIDECDFKQMRPLRKQMQVVFQDPFSSLSPRLSVGQIIEEV